MKFELALAKQTTGTYQFKSANSSDAVNTVYVRKSAWPAGNPPQAIIVEVSEVR
jgi:hypothetical protein